MPALRRACPAWARGLGVAFCAVLVASGARAQVAARVLATAGVQGRFATPVCDDATDLAPHPSALFTYALSREARSPDAPLVLDAGGLLGTGGVVRFAAEHDPEALVELVRGLGYRVLALGATELGGDRAQLVSLARRLRSRGIPLIATNLRCEEAGRRLCEVVRDADEEPLVLRAGQSRVAVLAMLDPEILERLEPERARGLRIDPVAEALGRTVPAARSAAEADVVVAVLGMSADRAIPLVDGLEERIRPDLVILADEGSRLLFARPVGVVPGFVTPPPTDAVEVVVREDHAVRAGVYQILAQPLGRQGLTVGEPVLDFLDAIGPVYCEVWGASLPGGRLERPLDRDGMLELVAALAREALEADVAIVNRSLLERTFRTAHERELTQSDLYVAIEHDEPLYEAFVSREWLLEVANRRGARGLATAGLTGTSGETRVRGRPLVARARYRVVTTRYLARQATGVLPALPSGSAWELVRASTLARWRRAEERDGSVDPVMTIREVAIRGLSERRGGDARDARVSPDEMPEWLIQGFVDGTFSGSSIDNPAGYTTSQLNRASTVALGVEVNVRADATAPHWTWENLGVFRYRTQWQAGAATMGAPRSPGAFLESVDQIQLRSTGSYRGFRSTRAGGSSAEPWIPDPYLELFVETEVTQPSTRAFHWLLLRPTLGARFPLTNDLEVKLQLGVEGQALQPGAEADVGLGAVVTLRPWDLLRMGERRVQLQGLVDVFFSDPGDANRWQLRGSFDASLDLAGPLALTFGVRAFLQEERGAGVGFALDATAGFRVGTLERLLGP